MTVTDTSTDALGELRYDPFDPATVRSPWATYARLRDEAPVYRLPTGRGVTHVLSRFADVFDAARDPATFSSANGLSLDGGDKAALGLLPTIVMMDPPEHTAYRRLVSRGFTPRQVATLEPEVRAFVQRLVAAMADQLAAGDEVDLIAALAGPLPSYVVATYLGVPEADRPRFDGWSTAIVAANAAGDVVNDARDAVGELYEYFADLIERRRAEPGDDMISTLAHAQLDGDDVRPEAILGYAFVMIAGGNDTATGLLGGSAELLAAHPDQRRLLVDDRSRIGDALDELLRLTSPVQGLSRCVLRDVTIHGVDIPAGGRVHLLYGAANRDPREFGPDADELDVTRRLPRIMTFSSGPHYCLGASAARLQGRIALEELLAAFPDFVVDPDAGTYAPGAFVRRFATLPFRAAP